MNFFSSCRKFLHASTIDYIYLLGSHSLGASCCVHCYVTAAYDCDSVTVHDRSVIFRQISLHEVDSCEVLVRWAYADQVFSRNVHEWRQSCACSDEYWFEALFLHELVNGDCSAHNCVSYKLYALCFQFGNFSSYDFLRKSELRNSVNQYASCLVESFKYCYLVSLVNKISCACQSCRPCADDCNLMTVWVNRLDFLITVVCCMPVSYESFKTADCNGFALGALYALSLALVFLRADTTADCRKWAVLGNDFISCLEVSFGNLCDEIRNLDIYRTSGNTRFFAASQAAHSFSDSHIFSITCTYF